MPQLHLLIVGEIVNQEVDVAGLMDEFSLGEVVHVTGYVPEKQSFMDWMATADFLVNLRHPTMGETSHSTLLAFSLARPVILFNHGWYAELPAEICYQIPVMDEEALFQAMAALATRPALRTQIGNQAQSYVVKNCDPEQIAGQYAGFINRVLLRPTPPATNYPG